VGLSTQHEPNGPRFPLASVTLTTEPKTQALVRGLFDQHVASLRAQDRVVSDSGRKNRVVIVTGSVAR
jgi:hypothetical protein